MVHANNRREDHSCLDQPKLWSTCWFSSSCVAKYCRGWPDGVSSNEDIRFWATAKLLNRTLRQTPNSLSLIKSIPCNLGTGSGGLTLPTPKQMKTPWCLLYFIPSLPKWVLHLKLSQLFMPISEWNELVQDRNRKLIVHMPMSQVKGKLLFLLRGKGWGKISFCRQFAKH